MTIRYPNAFNSRIVRLKPLSYPNLSGADLAITGASQLSAAEPGGLGTQG